MAELKNRILEFNWNLTPITTAVIPPKANRKEQRSCDWHLYKERHAIECMFGKLKYFRRITTRYEKKASHIMEMLASSAVLLWLR